MKQFIIYLYIDNKADPTTGHEIDQNLKISYCGVLPHRANERDTEKYRESIKTNRQGEKKTMRLAEDLKGI